MPTQRILWYFADPMCSWCYGFAPVIDAIEATYKAQLTLRLILGGLRPGTTEPVTPQFREEILHHWQEVNKRTGQPFKFEGAMADGFIYDTEPPSRAIVAVSELNPNVTFPYFKSIQRAFYADGQDVTQPEILAALAERQSGISLSRERAGAKEGFLELFNSSDIKKKTQAHFHQSQRSGITGFPTVVLQSNSGFELLTVGYRPFEDLKRGIDVWLAEH